MKTAEAAKGQWAMIFEHFGLTRRAPLWKASPGLFVTIPARKAS